MVGLSCLILSGMGTFLLRYPSSPPGPVLRIATALPTSTPIPTPTPAPLRVYVSGAVAHPDVYRLPSGAIVKDALAAAGGTLPGVDLSRINLAQQLFDQQQIHVPMIGETPLPQQPLRFSSEQGCVDVNVATLEELNSLPGIGPAYAQRIIEYRTTHGPFQDIEDLAQVKGIGPATLEKIRDRVCLH
jgi:competence protein ComEA